LNSFLAQKKCKNIPNIHLPLPKKWRKRKKKKKKFNAIKLCFLSTGPLHGPWGSAGKYQGTYIKERLIKVLILGKDSFLPSSHGLFSNKYK
jgi:hypothetical protein